MNQILKGGLLAELNFLSELDKLKSVLRQALLHDGSRRENTAEHSWHLALAVLVLRDYANEPINLERAMKMALIHDIVEIDAGDTFVYDLAKYKDKAETENRAALRIFGLLPEPLRTEFVELWREFEERECPESRFVAALDRFIPMFANSKTQGHSWKLHGIKKSAVIARTEHMKEGSAKLWAFSEKMLDECVAQGFLDAD